MYHKGQWGINGNNHTDTWVCTNVYLAFLSVSIPPSLYLYLWWQCQSDRDREEQPSHYWDKFQTLFQDHKHNKKFKNTYRVSRHGNAKKLENIMKDHCPFFSVMDSKSHPKLPTPVRQHLPPEAVHRAHLVNDFVDVYWKLS